MASFGAKYPYFNPVAEEPEGKLPVYKDQEPVRVGRLVKADLTVNLASGKLPTTASPRVWRSFPPALSLWRPTTWRTPSRASCTVAP